MKKKKTHTHTHTPLQDPVRRYIREISIAMVCKSSQISRNSVYEVQLFYISVKVMVFHLNICLLYNAQHYYYLI